MVVSKAARVGEYDGLSRLWDASWTGLVLASRKWPGPFLPKISRQL